MTWVRLRDQQGLTAPELMVVVGIIMALALVGLPAYEKWEKTSRDGKRISDIHGMAKFLEGEKIVTGTWPRESQGFNGRIGEGANIDNVLSNLYNGAPPHDPRGPGSGRYYYYYDGYHGWSPIGGVYTLGPGLFVAEMEIEENGNYTDLYTSVGGEGGPYDAASYMLLLWPCNNSDK